MSRNFGPVRNSRGAGNRREFLFDAGMGFAGMALGAMLFRDGITRAAGDDAPRAAYRLPKNPPRAKSVIWMFMVGGASHVESFDPKPALNEYAGKTIAESPFRDTLDSPFLKRNVREAIPGLHKVHSRIYPMQIGYGKCGHTGIEISDWWPHLRKCARDIAFVRSMWTTDNNHGAQIQFHTGRHALEGFFPTIGSWVHYGLGSLNDNLPQFVVLGRPLADCCGGMEGHGSDYLGSQHAGVRLKVNQGEPLPFASPGPDVYREEQRGEFELLKRLNKMAEAKSAPDPALEARIKSYELAFHMQMAVPEVLDFNSETKATREMYGLDHAETKDFGFQCLAARRLVERGTRFVQIFHGSNGGAGSWDAHSNLKAGHSKLSKQVDRPIAAMLTDLKQRGLLDETLVVWGTEFGRTPGAQGQNGRDHHPYGFSIWVAGGGIRGGTAHGATDEIGFHAVENRHYVTDLHATVFHQLGLDSHQLEIPGRKRLEIDHGHPILEIVA